MELSFTAPLWRHSNEGGWHFVSVPLELSEEVREVAGGVTGGFGSLRVEATLGATTWRTSVFPAATGEYVLPVKKPVRAAEEIEVDDVVEVSLVLVDLV